ncbi:hypothetical protein [Couchioplanes caeruleus]|uniref:Uncharacterized protein n=2 Tax=Couchioplanes caeruleus TaxID=56438 RepID=A0A1K0FH11_9ACTN|nr:hypothetical protein [Couchioplanes caeruleus]OJF12008.1 hypothetical protein BG844_22975 [Couchioplanes caeruleus subsp. caeruleus]ROP27372.1 hypothetical protein EDD30_0041 [Couchioplanes caeruleus]
MPITAELEDRLVYGLRRPTLADARESLRASVDNPDAVWSELLAQTGLAGSETTTAALSAMAQAMLVRGGGVGMCGNALHIRITAYTALGAVEDLIAVSVKA